MLLTMSDSWDCGTWDTWELSDIVGSTSNTLRQRGTMFHWDTVPGPKEKSCIVWTDLYSHRAEESPLLSFFFGFFTVLQGRLHRDVKRDATSLAGSQVTKVTPRTSAFQMLVIRITV